jgi:hypothetical protein
MHHLRMLWGLAFLLSANAGDGASGGAGAGTAAPPPGAGAPPPAGPDPEKIKAAARAEARAEFLKDLGFEDEDAYAKHKKAKADEENAKLSEGEKAKKLYTEALDARGKAEAKFEAEKSARKAAEDALALRDRLDGHGVLASERKFVEVELHDAEAAAKKASETFDEAKFFKDLRDKRPYFFGKDAPQLATTSPNTPAAGANGAPPANGLIFDASKLSDAEWSKWRQENNV